LSRFWTLRFTFLSFAILFICLKLQKSLSFCYFFQYVAVKMGATDTNYFNSSLWLTSKVQLYIR
jgi:hypothetical protein